ncbi:MAG TPA: hypothetical protein VGU67_02730 [Edaphobacter sp.]|nr:hypothetical protein [Edaphobacter sp.]
MRWKNRCPAVVYAAVNGRQQVIDRCYYEADEPHEHWSKNNSHLADWVMPIYNPYQRDFWTSFITWGGMYELKEKPNVGYWPRGTSTSKSDHDEEFRWWEFQRLMFKGISESDARQYLEEMKEDVTYHRRQQQMVDEFRAKLHFADRIVKP